MDKEEKLQQLIKSIFEWWEEHRSDTTGPFGDYNVYSEEPEFVVLARDILNK